MGDFSVSAGLSASLANENRKKYKRRETKTLKKRKLIAEWVQIAAGLLVFAFGVHLTIFANIGLAPWDCLGMGIAGCTGLTYGLSMTLMALFILGVDLLMKESIGYGTILDALLTGNFVQLFNDLNPYPLNENLLAGVGFMLAGFVFMALGMMIYMKGQQCCGPRDSLLVGLGKRMPKLPIGLVEVLLWAVVLVLGWALGGPVGIGTLISTLGAGAVMQLVYSLLHFEPRQLRHKNVFQVTRMLWERKET